MSARDEIINETVTSRATMSRLLDAYRAEVLAEAAPPCSVCETPIEWVDCPTGEWWAHHTHPEDGHDAVPPGGAA